MRDARRASRSPRLVDALDLPDVGLDALVLDLLDRAAHQLRAQLGVVAVGVAADRLELGRLGRHEQLEEELAVVLVQPVGEALQLAELALVQLGVAVGVVADEDLREVGVERSDVVAEVVAVLEVELVLAALLDRHREIEAVRLRLAGDVAAELLVDEHAAGGRVGARPAAFTMPSKIRCFASAIFAVCSGVGSPSMPNIFFWNDPRWSNARMYSLPS